MGNLGADTKTGLPGSGAKTGAGRCTETIPVAETAAGAATIKTIPSFIFSSAFNHKSSIDMHGRQPACRSDSLSVIFIT